MREAFVAVLSLIRVDSTATILISVLTLLKVALVLAPLSVLWLRIYKHHWFWLFLNVFVVVLSLPLLFAALSSPWMWFFFIISSLVGLWSTQSPHSILRTAVILPFIVLLEPFSSHSPLGDILWTAERLEARCSGNDGNRPLGFKADLAQTRYFSVTKLNPNTILLTGEKQSSWWLRRDENEKYFRLEKKSKVSGNLWEGCLLNSTLWFTHLGRITSVERLSDSAESHEIVTQYKTNAGRELDFVDAICDTDQNRILVSELTQGRFHSLSLENKEITAQKVFPGIHTQLVQRDDGMIVGIDTARLFLFDPQQDVVTASYSAGIVAMGVDVCKDDDAVIISDMAGRLRLFETDSNGTYHFSGGTYLIAPRRVAFSPDCTSIAVTSTDDSTLWLVNRKGLVLQKRYQIGPGLRDVTFISNTEIVAADACSATFISLTN